MFFGWFISIHNLFKGISFIIYAFLIYIHIFKNTTGA